VTFSNQPLEFEHVRRDESALAPWESCLVVTAPLAGYGLFIAKALAGPVHVPWAMALLLCAVAATFLAWGLTSSDSRLLERLDRNATPIALTLMALMAVGLIVTSVVQARCFAMSVYSEDTAYYSQILWNTLHGRFLAGNVTQGNLYDPPVSTDLALHVSPIVISVLLPVYALFPHFLTLLVLRDVALVAAAWPLFLLARERMGGAAAVAAVVLYLGNPVVLAQGFESFSLLHLAPLPLFCAFRAFARHDFRQFLAWTAIALGVREDLAIPLVGLGLWALVERQGFRWIGAGLGVPIVWWGIVTLAIQPAFRGASKSVLDVLAAGSGGPFGVYRRVLADPSWILDSLQAGGGQLLYGLLRSVGFVPVLGPEGLVAAPSLAATLFAVRTLHGAADPLSRFALLPSCALVAATIMIASRFVRRHRFGPHAFAFTLLLLFPLVNLLDGAKDAVQSRLLEYIRGHDASALWEAVGHIPDGVSVAAPAAVLPALSKRPRLFTLQYLDRYPQPRADYVLVDRRLDRVWHNPARLQWYAALVEDLTRSPEYETVWKREDYLLLRRRGEATR